MTTIVFFGDSVTFGQYVHHRCRWTTLVKNSIIEKKLFDDPLVFTHAISGQTTRQALERFPREVQEYSPDILFIQFGLNDCNKWDSDGGYPRVSQDAYRANLKEMIERSRLFHVKHIVLSTNYRTLKQDKLVDGSRLEESRPYYNEIVRSLSAEMGTHLLNIDKEFSSIDQEIYPNYLLPAPDLIHLTELGHSFYAQCVGSILEKIA